MNFVFNNPIQNIITQKIAFKSTPLVQNGNNTLRKDSFNSNPIYDNFRDKHYITQVAKSNPKITEILNKYKIPLNVNIEELDKLKQGHLLETRITAAKIYSALPPEIKTQINQIDLQQAAMLHDYGKILIPKNILNKKTALSPTEKEIMEQHAILGAELLHQQGVKKEVTELIKYHHQNLKGSGYPLLEKNNKIPLATEILSIADKYTALREDRAYKDALSKEQALKIIKEDVEAGLVSKEVFDALTKVI